MLAAMPEQLDLHAIRSVLASQLEAALCMLGECIAKCPDEHWDAPIAKYPFWHVAYHTLCFVDCYLSADNAAFARLIKDRAARAARGEPGAIDLHPAGMAELEEEYPSRRFTRGEMLAYIAICREKVAEVLGDGARAETVETLAGPSGFAHLPFRRAELHVYNARHAQHHAGQLGAFLRRAAVETRWVKAGWRE